MENNTINNKQNEVNIIDMLAAQRKLYDDAKKYSYLNIIFCVLVVVIILISKLFFRDCEVLINFATMYGLVALILKYFFSASRNKKRNLAARIQQLIDITLFRLEWTSIICGKKPTSEDIYYAKKKQNAKGLKDWYPLCIGGLDQSVATLICQQTNVIYNQKLRKKFLMYCNWFMAIVCILVLFTTLYKNMSICKILINMIVPIIPLISWYYDLRKDIISNSSKLEELKTYIQNCKDNLLQNKNNPTDKELQTIQNLIFQHRDSCYLIPSCIYNYLRDESENAMNYSAENDCKEIKEVLSK